MSAHFRLYILIDKSTLIFNYSQTPLHYFVVSDDSMKLSSMQICKEIKHSNGLNIKSLLYLVDKKNCN